MARSLSAEEPLRLTLCEEALMLQAISSALRAFCLKARPLYGTLPSSLADSGLHSEAVE